HFFTEHLEASEKCGFKVEHLESDTKIHEGGIEFDQLRLITPNSLITDQFAMKTLDWKDYNDFNNKVRMEARLHKSRINTKDLSYFTNNLKDYHTIIRISGYGEGFLNHLKGKNTEFKIFDNTEFKGDWSMTGLPDFENTILDFEVKSFKSDYDDLKSISLNNIPSNFSSLGRIHYSGTFSGFYNDFITYGTTQTAIGNFESDINIKYKEGLDKATYSGFLKTDYFKLREFMPESQIDDIAFMFNLKGQGMSRSTYKLTVDGDINELGFLGYSYQNIKVNGTISQESFEGYAEVRDKNLDMDFDGLFLSNLPEPVASLKAVIRHSNLATFGFDTTAQNVSGTFVLDFVGRDLDNAKGSISGSNIKIVRNSKSVEIPYAIIRADDRGAVKVLSLESNVLTASIKGQFTLKQIDISLMHLMHNLIPAYFAKPLSNLPNEDFFFNFDVIDPYAITSLYVPELSLEPFKGEGRYRSSDQSLQFETNNDEIRYGNIKLKGLRIVADKNSNSDLKLKINLMDLTDGNYLNINGLYMDAMAFGNKVHFSVNGADTSFKIGVDARGDIFFVEDSIFVKMSDVDLNIDNTIWQLDSNAVCLLTGQNIDLSNFNFKNIDQFISLNGEFGDNASNRMEFLVYAFSLKTINHFLKKAGAPELGGISSGKITYNYVDGVGKYNSNLRISDFKIGNDTIGDFTIYTGEQALSSKQHFKVSVDKGLLDSLNIEGDIDFASKNNNLNLYAKLPPSEIRVFEPYLSGIFKNMKGKIMTKDSLHISGKFSNPVIKGEILINNASMLVDYLNVPIQFNARIQSDKNLITILPFAFYDDKGKSGNAKGYIFHTGCEDFKFNLNLWGLDKFHVLNTTKIDNDLYYGQGYASGNASFNGPFEKLDIRINARTEKGTKFSLPISEGDASGFPSYVHFKSTKKKSKQDLDDFPINSLIMDIEATSDAEIEIIFDETLGDKIKGTGIGNIKMEMNNSADFYMFGTYRVVSGSYLFTAFDLYNKPFLLRPGGSITWYGDPLDAKLDMSAYYTVNADPSPLLSAISFNNTNNGSALNQLITVESELYLKGNLFTPEVYFGLNFPKLLDESRNAATSLSSIISRIKSDKEEVNRQVFSLLIMRKFLPPTFAQIDNQNTNAGSSALSSAGSDLLSSQLTNWLNNIDPNWRVNVIYKNGSITLPPEYGLILSSKFFNDKLTFDGSYSSYSTYPNINLEYKVTKKGNVRVKAYTRSSFNQVNTTSLSTPITTSGVGIVYTIDFNVFRLFKYKRTVTKVKKDESAPDENKDEEIIQRDSTSSELILNLSDF
ncbi:MAG: translocation/assembly module TamB domain-containing protein, partial [Bacteroidia bacterium]|nr:translocation/assembly module TamB domain-containing protein [Bacteroidia bacterium]